MDIIMWLLVGMVTICLIRYAVRGAMYHGDENLHGKVVIVTGANSGIGYEVALNAAKRGATVILGCRNEQRGKKAERDIVLATQNKNVRFRQLDLASNQSIRKFVRDLNEEESSVYALVNNAGIFWVPFSKTEDGCESNFVVNHLGHFLLTLLLLPLLADSKPKEDSRVVFVGSLMYIFGRLDLTDVNYERRGYNFLKAYSDSKLANVLTSSELAHRLKCSNVRTYCVDPGIVFTNIGQESYLMGSSLYRSFLYPVMCLLLKSAEEGAQTVIYCLCSERVKDHTGKLYRECRHVYPWPSAQDKNSSVELWNVSIELSQLNKKELEQYVILDK